MRKKNAVKKNVRWLTFRGTRRKFFRSNLLRKNEEQKFLGDYLEDNERKKILFTTKNIPGKRLFEQK